MWKKLDLGMAKADPGTMKTGLVWQMLGQGRRQLNQIYDKKKIYMGECRKKVQGKKQELKKKVKPWLREVENW